MLKTEIFDILLHGEIVVGEVAVLLHGEIVVGEVAVGEISDWGNCCWGNWLLGKLLLGKLVIGEIVVGEIGWWGNCCRGRCLGEVLTGEVALGI